MERRSVAAADDEHHDARSQQLDEWREMETRRIQEEYAEAEQFRLRGEAIIREAHARENRCFRGVPASDKAMLALREPKLDDEEDCAVCLEDFKEGDTLMMMPCSHCFHIRCIYKWLRASGVCPCCRFKLPSEEAEAVVQAQDRN